MNARLFVAAVLLLAGTQLALASEPASVKVTLSDENGKMSLTLSQDTVKAGEVEFHITNASTDMMHEFLLTPWKGAITSLPYDAKASQVIEDKLPHLRGVEDMKPGLSTTLRLALAPGEYVVFCDQVGHYKHGMEHRFTVTK
jgi:uncharacterized cupredoxin-like copper-binding protein